MTLEQQAEAEAKRMVEQFLKEIGWIPYSAIPTFKKVAKKCATIANDQMIAMRVPPMSYYELVREKIINYK